MPYSPAFKNTVWRLRRIHPACGKGLHTHSADGGSWIHSALPYSRRGKGYTFHIYTTGSGEGYTLHVHITPCTSTLLAVERDTPSSSTLQRLLMDTPCTSTLQALEKDNHCTSTVLTVEKGHTLHPERKKTSKHPHCLLHCYKTLRRFPPPWPDDAGLIGQGRGKWLPYKGGEFAHSATEVFHSQPKFSVITGNFRWFLLWKKEECACWDWSHILWITNPFPLPLDHSYLAWKVTK